MQAKYDNSTPRKKQQNKEIKILKLKKYPITRS